MTKKYLIIDVGGTNLKYGIFNDEAGLVQRNSIPTPTSGLDEFVTRLQQLINQFGSEIVGIGFSVPGTVDHQDERIYGGGSLPFLDKVRLADFLDFNGPIVVENDAKAAVLAEAWRGNLNGISDGAAIVLGTAVGGGIIINGRLVHGSRNQAGELSFMLNWHHGVDEDNIGNFGSAVTMIADIAETLGIPNNGPDVFKAIEDGEPRAVKRFNHFCYDIAVLINNIQCVVDLKRFVIGGGISARQSVIDTINDQYDQMVANNPAVGIALTKPEIVSSKFHNEANLYGALDCLQKVIN